MDWSAWRRRWMTEPLYRRMRNSVSPLTAFQRQVLSSGDAWWEAQLLSGRPDWGGLTYVRPAVLSAAEREFLDGPVMELCVRLEQARNQGGELAAGALWPLLRGHRYEAMAIPAEHGGLGLSAWAQSELLRRVALRSVSVAYLLAARFVFGPANLLVLAGSDAQREHWLPRLAGGQECGAVASFAVENDIVPIQATGVVLREDAGDHDHAVLRLNWSGARHAPGPRPGLLVLPFRLHDPDGVLGPAGERGVCVALVDTSHAGVVHYPGSCSWRHGASRTLQGQSGEAAPDMAHGGVFDGYDVQLPLAALVGAPAAIDRGLPALLATQSVAKGIALPALSSASVSLAAHASSAVLRLQGDGPGSETLGARSRLGRLAATAYRVEAGRRFLAAGLNLGYRPVLTTALLDLGIFDEVRRSMSDSMDLLGGSGPTPALAEWQDGLHELLPVLFGLDGLAAKNRNTAVLALGVMRVHPYLVQEIEALGQSDTEEGSLAFDRLVWKHAGVAIGASMRAITTAWTRGRFSSCPRLLGPVARHYRRVNRYAAALALLVEILQPGVRPIETHSEPGLERLLRALAALVSLCAVLKRWQDDGRHNADLPLVEWCAADAYHSIDNLMESMLENLGLAGAGAVLKGLLLPPGMRSPAPDDAVTLDCAQLLLVPSDTRERLVGAVWANHGLRHLGALERAYECVVNVEGLREQIRQAGLKDWRLAHVRGGLTDAQAAALEAAETAVIAALRGDEAAS
ncbi:MAG: acyl-CoA dehydrogenase domain-containing protein [Burkholderiaceae bacterium]